MDTSTLMIVIAGVILIVILILISSHKYPIVKNQNQNQNQINSKYDNGEVGIDPVSDPAYNMKQVAKQCILLEEHIAEKSKRCRDCITKHFLHIIGLLNEAVWLSTTDLDKFPYLEESEKKFEWLFNKWLDNYTSEAILLQILDELRRIRKQIIAYYYFGETGETSCGGNTSHGSCSG